MSKKHKTKELEPGKVAVFYSNPYFNELMVFLESVPTSQEKLRPIDKEKGLFQLYHKNNVTEFKKRIQERLLDRRKPWWPFKERLTVVVSITGPKKDIEKWGRNGHVNFNAAQIFTLTHYGRQAIDNAKRSTSPIQVLGTEFEPGVVSQSRLKEVAATGENRKLYTFDSNSSVPHAMIHWREFNDDEARVRVRAMTLDFLESRSPLSS